MLAFASSCCLFAKSSLDSSGCCGAPKAIPVPSPVANAPANAVLGFFCTNSDTPVPILDKPSVAKYFIPDKEGSCATAFTDSKYVGFGTVGPDIDKGDPC